MIISGEAARFTIQSFGSRIEGAGIWVRALGSGHWGHVALRSLARAARRVHLLGKLLFKLREQRIVHLRMVRRGRYKVQRMQISKIHGDTTFRGCTVKGWGFRIWGLRFGVWGFEFEVWGLGIGFGGWGLGIWGLGFEDWALGLGAWFWGLQFGVGGSGFGFGV